MDGKWRALETSRGTKGEDKEVVEEEAVGAAVEVAGTA